MRQGLILWGFIVGTSALVAEDYDPLRLSTKEQARTLELMVSDKTRDREIPILVYMSSSKATEAPAPVVLFSHGLGGTRHGSAYLGQHWAARGYFAVFLQHPGSDDSAWKDTPITQRMAALKKAASAQNYLARVRDVVVVIDQLEKWHGESGQALHQRLRMDRLGMSGHSFGAVTTQAVAGQKYPLVGHRYTDVRIKAALPMSPSAPQRGITAKEAFADVKIPWLLMTGTKDSAPIGGQTIASRRDVYPALPPGSKYELVLDNAEHSVFTERALPGEKEKRNPNHHRVILALSTAFWDAYLREDTAARSWLDGAGPRTVLQEKDQWQRE